SSARFRGPRISIREHQRTPELFHRLKKRHQRPGTHLSSARAEIPQSLREWHETQKCCGRRPPQPTLPRRTMRGMLPAHSFATYPVHLLIKRLREPTGCRFHPRRQEETLSDENMKPRRIQWTCC